MATGANFGRGPGCDPETTRFAFPEGHAAFGAQVSIKVAVSRVTALGAHHFFLFIRHFYLSLGIVFFISYYNQTTAAIPTYIWCVFRRRQFKKQLFLTELLLWTK
jgi:hypothetical protein